jgi:hypothetical protein
MDFLCMWSLDHKQRQPPVGHGFHIHVVSRSQTTTSPIVPWLFPHGFEITSNDSPQCSMASLFMWFLDHKQRQSQCAMALTTWFLVHKQQQPPVCHGFLIHVVSRTQKRQPPVCHGLNHVVSCSQTTTNPSVPWLPYPRGF